MSQTLHDKSQRVTLFTILLLSFFGSFGNPIIIPLFPKIMEHFQITPVETTLLISMYALPGALIIPVLGFMEDKMGRKPIMLASLVVCIVACIGMGMAQSFKVLLVWRMLLGLCVTPLEALCNTLISDNFTAEERVKYIGHNMSALYIGVAVFPLVSTGLLYIWGWRAAIMSPAVLAVPLLFLCLRMPMRYHHSEFNLASYTANLRSVLVSRRLLSLFGIRMVMALVMFGTLHSYMPFLVTEKLCGSQSMPGIIMALFSVFMALGSVFLGHIGRIFGQLRLAVYSSLCLTAGMLGFMLAPSISMLLLPVALFGVGSGVLSAVVTARVSMCTQTNTRATIMSIYSTAFRGSQSVSPFISSFLFVGGGFTLLYGVAAVATLLLTWIVYRAFRN